MGCWRGLKSTKRPAKASATVTTDEEAEDEGGEDHCVGEDVDQ